MSDCETIYEIGLSMTKRMTAETAFRLQDLGLTAEDFFRMETPDLTAALGMKPGHGFERMDRDEALFKARKEYETMQKHNIKGVSLMDPRYPVRLYQTPDAPLFLYILGDEDLEGDHVINIVGTRHCTTYGTKFCNTLIEGLASYFPDLTVVSGLAYGIDTSAHRAALDNNVKTVAVVAHGLHRIYPPENRDLAAEIVRRGGSIVSEYPFGENCFRQRFLERNRIVAGLSEATIVAESGIKGGALATANIANSYGRDVFAVPGRVNDEASAGCNNLIRRDKARLIGSAADLTEALGWTPMETGMTVKQRNLFPELEGDEKTVYELLRFTDGAMHFDQIHMKTLIPVARLMSVLGELEFDGIINRLPGNKFEIG